MTVWFVRKLSLIPKNLSILTFEAVRALAPLKLKLLFVSKGDIITS